MEIFEKYQNFEIAREQLIMIYQKVFEIIDIDRIPNS
jgi:hypothetical protein